MKQSALLLFALLTTGTAHANLADVLICSTPGDALASFDLGINAAGDENDTVYLSASFENDDILTYTARTEKGVLDKMLGKGLIEIVGTTSKSIEFGGAVSDAVLLALSKQEAGYVGHAAIKGKVYSLSCRSIE